MMDFNLYPAKLFCGFLAGLSAALINHLFPLFVTVTVFEFADFATGVHKSYVVAHRHKERFAFESVKAWKTIYKYVFILIGIFLAELLDQTLTENRLGFANYFTAVCCRAN